MGDVTLARMDKEPKVAAVKKNSEDCGQQRVIQVLSDDVSREANESCVIPVKTRNSFDSGNQEPIIVGIEQLMTFPVSK